MIKITKEQMERLGQQQTMDSPDSDFAKKVRDRLVKNGLFKPVDETDVNASRKALTSTSILCAASPQ